MSATIAFILAAAGLLATVLAMLLPPLLRDRAATAQALSRREANLDILRDQMAELERERTEGSLAECDFNQAREELQRRLLEEVVEGEGRAPSLPRKDRKTALALLLVLPLAAALGYIALGTPDALNPARSAAHMEAQQFDELLNRLTERLKANPDDTKGWIMLARSYKALGRFAESAEAFSHGGSLLAENPALLADYAEVLVQLSGGVFAGKPDALISQALKINPDEPQALFLAGASAIERKNFAAGIKYWKRLLQQLEPDSEEARSLATLIDQAKSSLPTPPATARPR